MMSTKFQPEHDFPSSSPLIIMQKVVFAFVAFAAVTLYALSRGGNVDVSSEARGISYADSSASAPVAAASGNSAPDATPSEINTALAAKR
jgi:hypothetical protein